MDRMSNQLRYIDLFAGCGGLSEGFDKEGHFKAIAHVEWDAAPINTLRRRAVDAGLDPGIALRFDIQKTNQLLYGDKVDEDFNSGEGLIKMCEAAGGIDLVIGGPPCQAYSIAGRVRDEHGMHFDYRNYLFESYLAVVHSLQPSIVVFENVPGIISAAPGGTPIQKRVVDAFHNAGYAVLSDLRNCIIDMSRFGVPQRRKRVIIVGLKESAFGSNGLEILRSFYNQYLPDQMRPVRTVGEAIGHLPSLLPSPDAYMVGGKKFSHSPSDSGIPDHCPRFHSKRDQQIFRDLAEDAVSDSPKHQDTAALKRIYEQRTGKTSAVHKYYVLRQGEPSNLIPAHLFKDGLRHIHYDPAQARSITVREAALLQGFPEDFIFTGSQGDRYKMIGNAVPPIFSAALARAISRLFHAVASTNSRPRQTNDTQNR